MSLAATSSPLVPLQDIEEARKRISGVVVHTPLVPLHPRPGNSRDETLSEDIFLKLETAQPCNSFKIRGIFNAVSLLSDVERQRGLSTVSAGNTAQALAWCARYYGTSARSLMPDHAPKTKIDAVTLLGATPVLRPVDEVFDYMKTAGWTHEPYAFIHPWTNPNVMRGHGSMGIEIIEDCPEVDTVYIPVGGGGLISGVGAALKHLRPSVKVIAVEPEGCPALHRSFELGKPAEVSCDTSCDGVAVPYITEEMWPFIRTVVDEVVLVSENEVESAIRHLASTNKIIVEPSAALSVAAALKHRRQNNRRRSGGGGKCVCVITGGSIDTDKLVKILSKL